jgi:hypothetical protein
MAAKEISVKKYVVRLNGEERERLETLIRKGKSPARRVLKARILLKADVSAGKGWSDNRIIEALEASPSMVYPGAQTPGGRRLRGRVEPQAARDACRCSDFGRREGGQADCLGLFQAAQGTRTLDLAVVGEQGRAASTGSSRRRPTARS